MSIKIDLSDLASLVARLESVAGVLEGGGGGGGGGGGAAAAAAAPSEEAAFVTEFDEVLEHVAKFVECGIKIGGKVADQCKAIDEVFKAQRAFLAMASASKKPADWPGSAEILSPMSIPMGVVGEIGDFGDFKNHTKFMQEAVQAAAWVCMDPKPGPHVKNSDESAMFYGNKVLMAAKGKDENQVAWINAWKAFSPALQAYIKTHHTTGVTWNPKGADAGAAAAATAPAGKGGKGKGPPPPPPDLSTMDDKPGKTAPDSGALFAELNRGGAVTSGLKKVTKNKAAMGEAAVVKSKVKKSKVPPKFFKKSDPTGDRQPSKTVLDGTKWMVEYHFDERNNGLITIDDSTVKQTLNIYRCHNTVVKVSSKINAILIDDCSRVSVVCDDVVSSIDVVNCQNIEVQAEGKVPTVLVDKVDGCQLYLSAKGLDATIITSKISEMNVSTPGATEDDDLVEQALAEQFTNTFDGKQWNCTAGTECS